MSRRTFLIAALILVFAVGAWQISSKWDVLSQNDVVAQLQEAVGLQSSAQEFGSSGNHSRAPENFSEDDWVDDKSKPPRTRPAPEFEDAPADEIIPFAVDTPLLSEVVPLPDKLPPHVYVAYGQNSSDKQTSASTWFGEFMKFQARAQRTSSTILNFTPNNSMLHTLNRAYQTAIDSVSYDQYLADARAQGADFLILPVVDGEPDAPFVQLKMVDLNSSRTEQWQPTGTAVTSVHDAIVEAARAVMKFAGVDDKTIAASGVTEGAPSDETFARIAGTNPDEYSWEYFNEILEKDPGCIYIYTFDSGTTTLLQLSNEGLKRFPSDARLQISKAYLLAENDSSTALIRYTSELIRRYPDNLYVYSRLPSRLQTVFPVTMPPRDTPEVFAVMTEQMDNFVSRYPDFLSLNWNRAYMHKALGDYVRGNLTLDRIPSEALAVYRNEQAKSYELMTEVVKNHQDLPTLLGAYTYFMTAGGGASKKELRDHVEKIAKLDPRATDAELRAAFWQGAVGYGSGMTYIRLIDQALKRHQGDPQAIKDITNAVGQELQRQVGWEQMTEHEAYTTTNSYLARFLTGADFVYGHGMNLGFEYDKFYYRIADMRGDTELINEWKRTAQNSYVASAEAKFAMDNGDWKECLRLAEAALPYLNGGDREHLCRYYKIKSLWKLKRYEESLKAARDGIFAFPREQTFPYMYAVVGLEYGQDLETAFDCAWRAVDLGTDNPGCNETFEKLRSKLGKPDHPALIALK